VSRISYTGTGTIIKNGSTYLVPLGCPVYAKRKPRERFSFSLKSLFLKENRVSGFLLAWSPYFSRIFNTIYTLFFST